MKFLIHDIRRGSRKASMLVSFLFSMARILKEFPVSSDLDGYERR